MHDMLSEGGRKKGKGGRLLFRRQPVHPIVNQDCAGLSMPPSAPFCIAVSTEVDSRPRQTGYSPGQRNVEVKLHERPHIPDNCPQKCLE